MAAMNLGATINLTKLSVSIEQNTTISNRDISQITKTGGDTMTAMSMDMSQGIVTIVTVADVEMRGIQTKTIRTTQ